MRIFGKTSIDFLKPRRKLYAVSALIIVIGLSSLFAKGVDLGIDFLGGTEIVVRFTNQVAIGDVRSVMDRIGFNKAEIKTFGDENEILIRTVEQGEGTIVADRMRNGLRESFPSNPFTVLKEDKIGPKIGAELRRDAVYAIVASLIAIMLYVGFRFKFVYGVGALIAVFHDVLVTLGMVSLFDGLVPQLNLEISQNMIAAFLTLVGLSVNDTVVIFDRIRENQKIFRSMSLMEIMNKSLNETLSRTIITSGTIFLVLAVLFVFGGEVNRGFSFALVIGIVTGTYSSIYIASATVIEWAERARKKTSLTR
jgi:preprotein translocase subunit SecF